MPKLQFPRSDEDRLWILERIADPRLGGHYLGAEIVAAAASQHVAYEAAFHALTGPRARYFIRKGELRDAKVNLIQHVRDCWAGVRRRTKRMGHGAFVFGHYDLPQSGTPPKLTRWDDWLIAAEQIIGGDARAVAAGLPPLCNPSAAEIAAALAQARAADGAATQADADYDQAQAALEAHRAAAIALIREALAHLRFTLRDHSPSSQRRILRHFSFKFRDGNEG